MIFTKVDDANLATDRTRYPHRDYLGSIDALSDEAGAITEARSYDAWGLPRNPDWIGFHNTERAHSTLDGQTPAEAYRPDNSNRT